jgi:hypothetical protein
MPFPVLTTDPGTFCCAENGYVADCYLRNHFPGFSPADRSDVRQNFLLDCCQKGTLSRASDTTAPQSYLFRTLLYSGISYIASYHHQHDGTTGYHEIATDPEYFDNMKTLSDSTSSVDAFIDINKFLRFVRENGENGEIRSSYKRVRDICKHVIEDDVSFCQAVGGRELSSNIVTLKKWAKKFNEEHRL